MYIGIHTAELLFMYTDIRTAILPFMSAGIHTAVYVYTKYRHSHCYSAVYLYSK